MSYSEKSPAEPFFSFFPGGLWCWVYFVHVLNKHKNAWLVSKETLKRKNLRYSPLLQTGFCNEAGISHLGCPFCSNIFPELNLTLVLTVVHSMAWCQFLSPGMTGAQQPLWLYLEQIPLNLPIRFPGRGSIFCLGL